MFIRLVDIFSTREKCSGASGRGIGTTMLPYPSYTSCILSVDIPWSQNAIIISFTDIFNDTAKKNTGKYMGMKES
jgi:hypothetical protein